MNMATYGERSLRDVSSVMLRAYLTANGWVHVADWADRAAVFSRDESGRPPRIVVPMTESFGDYPDRVLDALETLEDVEERPGISILNSVTAVSADQFRITALDGDGPISLHQTAHLHSEANALLNAAARSTERPRAAHGGRLSTQVSQFLEQIRPVQLSNAKFDLTLQSPVPRTIGQADIFDGNRVAPFGRRVAKRLVDALSGLNSLVIDAEAKGNLSVFEQAVPRGVSSNLLDAVARLAERSGRQGAGVGIQVAWALLRLEPGPPPPEFQFSRQAVDVLDEGSRHLRAKEPDADQHLTADIVLLSSEYGESFDGQAVLMADLGGGPIALRTVFNEADKADVIEAFEHGILIEVDGDVVHKGRRRELRNPVNVRLLGNGRT